MVAFRSDAFNRTDPKDYFINECCFGDDVGKWLIRELKGRGIDVEPEPDQEDWGWYITCRADGIEHTIGISFRPADTEVDPGEWLCFVERRVGLLERLRGRRKEHVVDTIPLRTVQEALRSADHVRDVRWHFKGDFDALNEDRWAGEPNEAPSGFCER